jgi:hypothetical protein
MALWHVVKAGFVTLIQKQNKRAWNDITHHPKKTKLKTVLSAHKTMGTAFWDVGRFFTTSGMLQCYLLPTDVPEVSSCTVWQTTRKENDHPATWQHMTPQWSSVQGEDSEEQVTTSAPSTAFYSRPNPPRLPSFWIQKGSDARPALSLENHPHHLWTDEMVF